MDLLYVYDDKIACDRDGNYYTGSAFSQEIFDRYLAQFDTLTLLMRRAPVSPDDMQTLARMNRLTDARIRVVFYPDRRESLARVFEPSTPPGDPADHHAQHHARARGHHPCAVGIRDDRGALLPPDRKAVSGRGRRLPVGQPDAPQPARKGAWHRAHGCVCAGVCATHRMRCM